MTSLQAQEQHARAALEWPLLLDRIAGRCTSRAASAYVRALLPADTRDEARKRLRRMHDALELFNAGHPLPVREFPELGELFERVRADGVASGLELWALIGVLSLARDLRVYAKTHRAVAPDLAAAISSDSSLDQLRERLGICIDEGGSVADRASPELSRARSKVRDAQGELKRRLGTITRSVRGLAARPVLYGARRAFRACRCAPMHICASTASCMARAPRAARCSSNHAS